MAKGVCDHFISQRYTGNNGRSSTCVKINRYITNFITLIVSKRDSIMKQMQIAIMFLVC